MDMAEVALRTGVDWIWGMPDWVRFQLLLVLVRASVGIGQAGLALGTC